MGLLHHFTRVEEQVKYTQELHETFNNRFGNAIRAFVQQQLIT
jgi:hypothetical protein